MIETMTAVATAQIDSPAPDSRKRQQVLDGARKAFLEHGFDGASVNDIVKAAGVSKGTVYAYFPSKERLFETLVFEDRRRQAERLIHFEGDDRDPALVLGDLGLRLMRSISEPGSVAYARTVIAAAGKFPEVGRAYFEAGPQFVLSRLAAYLGGQAANGRLNIAEPERAAAQFLDLCNCNLAKPMLFGVTNEVPDHKIVDAVASAVKMFMAYYGPRR